MSKQQNDLKRILNDLFDEVIDEYYFHKITDNPLHPNIRVDFYIPKFNLVIEVHGIQHAKVSSFGRNKVDAKLQYVDQISRDDRLRNLCKKEKINYEEFWYNEKINVANVVMKLLKYLNDK